MRADIKQSLYEARKLLYEDGDRGVTMLVQILKTIYEARPTRDKQNDEWQLFFRHDVQMAHARFSR